MEGMGAVAPSLDSSADELRVARVIYASQALVQLSIYPEMERIRASAVKHNAPEEVFTALLYRSGWFLHWKEGPGSAVPRIMAQVAKDPRHHSSQIVHSSWGPRRLLGVWSMGILQSDEQDAEMPRRVAELRREMGAGIEHDPATVWHRLAMPASANAAEPASAALPLQNILVCSAHGTQPFELVEFLADKVHAGIVRGRLASVDFEVGVAYVDYPQSHRVLRIVGLARNGLGVPLTRALLNAYSHVVMLLGDAEEDNRKLFSLVETACAGLDAPPALVAVGTSTQMHSELRDIAARRGITYRQAVSPSGPDSMACWEAIEPQLQLGQ